MADKHWTRKSPENMAADIMMDFGDQLNVLTPDAGVNFVEDIVRLATLHGSDITIIAYDAGGQNSGPVNSEVFLECWKRCGCPRDMWGLEDTDAG